MSETSRSEQWLAPAYFGLFPHTRKNLLTCIVLHAMADALPAMTMIPFGGS